MRKLKSAIITVLIAAAIFISSPFIGMTVAALLDQSPGPKDGSMLGGSIYGMVVGFLIAVPFSVVRLIYIFTKEEKDSV
ncbi:hypothetical protein [Cerasicoccus frondis]|uniref:hypothetical protein n=1 Tax=Cerasicoccus frondis TaxID=490090 RepID=UPI002852612F|nr:hypothetical protein [Cerasicoccus frondis]